LFFFGLCAKLGYGWCYCADDVLSCRVINLSELKNETKQNDTIVDSYLFCSFEVSIRGIDMPFCELQNCLSYEYRKENASQTIVVLAVERIRRRQNYEMLLEERCSS